MGAIENKGLFMAVGAALNSDGTTPPPSEYVYDVCMFLMGSGGYMATRIA